ncbi:MAG: hypothetical protein IAI48_13535 [Candidatus Eremiobacteraeota bacterium]|nr:hypothetical protein [Candidatus Eremiobacteraeota bacterium]
MDVDPIAMALPQILIAEVRAERAAAEVAAAKHARHVAQTWRPATRALRRP